MKLVSYDTMFYIFVLLGKEPRTDKILKLVSRCYFLLEH